MFNLKQFQNNLVLEPLVDKLNKFLSKNKTQKVLKLIVELESLLDQPEHQVPITYVLSILAELSIDLISQETIQRIEPFLKSENIKLRLNSIIVIGFFLIAKPELGKLKMHSIATLLTDESKDIRDNVHFFLSEIVKIKPDLANLIIDILLNSLPQEGNEENIISLLNMFEFCSNLNYDELFRLRETLKLMISSFHNDLTSGIFTKLLTLIEKFFPSLEIQTLDTIDSKTLTDLLEEHFLMKKSNFTELSKTTNINLKEYLKKFQNSKLREKKTYFYTRSDKNITFVYELESSKLVSFFEKKSKISPEFLRETFSEIIQNDSELRLFIKMLMKLNIIRGYYSKIGFFYSSNYIKSNLVSDLNQKGIMKLNKFNFLPPHILRNIIKDIKISQKDELLQGQNKSSYYSLKMIQEQINIEAAKNSVVDLKSYRGRITDEDFINLIKKLPKEYLSSYHKGTQWLTNLGTLKISNEIQNSKIFGFFDISKNSNKLKIGQMLLFDVFINTVDDRSGIWDKKKEIFFYSKFLTEKIETLSSIPNDADKEIQINLLANELNINKNHISAKLDENLKLIGKEIKNKDKIEINEYLEKTGMDLEVFMKFIDDLGVRYFKKADQLLFKEEKIEESKKDIKFMLLDKSKSAEYLNLGNFDINSNLIKDLIHDLLKDGKLRGIFYEDEGEILFYTERGIRKLMLENSFLFSFGDLFYGKELSQDETELMKTIFDNLIARKRLRGHFDEESLTFSSDEILFAKDYNTVLFEFENNINKYNQAFESEYKKIKKILTKKEETIFPYEIKLLQEIIDRINGKYVWWRNSLEAFIVRANQKLLKDQGVSVKNYKNLFSTEQKEEIKLFEEDPEVVDNLKNFKSWVKVFNKLEVKYPSVIFYHKRIATNPEDSESKNKLKDLFEELFLS